MFPKEHLQYMSFKNITLTFIKSSKIHTVRSNVSKYSYFAKDHFKKKRAFNGVREITLKLS